MIDGSMIWNFVNSMPQVYRGSPLVCIAAAAPAPFGRRPRPWECRQRPDDAELEREAARLRDRHEQAEEAELQLLAGVA